MRGPEQIERGNLQAGADILAEHEQVEVVQQVYDRHADVFDDLGTAEAIMPGDQTSIPIADHCTRYNLVSLGDLDIANPQDRVTYYGRLIKRLRALEGLGSARQEWRLLWQSPRL